MSLKADKEQILIVDENKYYRELLRKILQEWDYDVYVCGGVTESFDLLSKEQVDKIILSYDFDDGKGIGIVKAVLELEPDILIYANSDSIPENNELLRYGCILSLEKDIDIIERIFKNV